MWLIVGLGNPGEKYADTYHNVGFRVVERFSAKHNLPIREPCGPALVSGTAVVSGVSAAVVMPQTFMNNSGAALGPVLERFGAGAGDLIVVYDDIALPLGKLRIRQKGSAGGHNGIKSVISALGSDEFLRVRVGIRPDRDVDDVRDFVLSRVAKRDRPLLAQAEDAAVRAVEALMTGGLDKVMAEFNGIDLRTRSIEPDKKDS